MSMKLIKIEDKTKDYWLELKGDDGSRIIEGNKQTPIYPIHAVAKWDGCVIYRDFANGYGYDHKHDDSCEAGIGCCEQVIHICDIDEMIETLQGIKEQAIKHFGKDWGK